MFQWESYVSLGVLIIVIIVPRSVFAKSSSIKLYKEDKRLLFNSDPLPPAEQKLEMPCDNICDGFRVPAAFPPGHLAMVIKPTGFGY